MRKYLRLTQLREGIVSVTELDAARRGRSFWLV
jgi:hypothetical protein